MIEKDHPDAESERVWSAVWALPYFMTKSSNHLSSLFCR